MVFSPILQYPCFTELESQFYPFHHAAQLTLPSPANFPSPCPSTVTVQYFGIDTVLTLLPMAPFAILNQFVRAEKNPLVVPPELPMNRQEALMRGIVRGPTKEDVECFNRHSITRFDRRSCGGLQNGQEHDPDWYRALRGLSHSPLRISSGAYVLHTLTGLWYGSFMVKNFFNFTSISV